MSFPAFAPRPTTIYTKEYGFSRALSNPTTTKTKNVFDSHIPDLHAGNEDAKGRVASKSDIEYILVCLYTNC